MFPIHIFLIHWCYKAVLFPVWGRDLQCGSDPPQPHTGGADKTNKRCTVYLIRELALNLYFETRERIDNDAESYDNTRYLLMFYFLLHLRKTVYCPNSRLWNDL